MTITRAALLALFAAGLALAADPFAGTWKLTKSTEQAAKPGGLVVFEEIPGGVRTTSPTTKESTELITNGKEQAPGGGSTTIRLGADSRIVRRINIRIIDVVFQRNGKSVGSIRREVSEDGRLLTITGDGIDLKGQKFHAVATFAKQ